MIEKPHLLFTYAHDYVQSMSSETPDFLDGIATAHVHVQYTVRVKNKCSHKLLLCFINNHLITTT